MRSWLDSLPQPTRAPVQYLYIDSVPPYSKAVLAACNLGCPDPLPLERQGLL